ncbi:MAG: hypothetical protein QXR06_00125 [Candidatus Bathyarchaeia archaeon]
MSRKMLGLILIFNSIASLISALGILSDSCLNVPIRFHETYFVNKLLFVFVVLTSILNLAPAKTLGKIEIRRLLFHHYVYGFMFILLYFTSAMLLSIMQLWVWEGQIYIILLLYWGAALVIDDIYDISPRIAVLLDAVTRRVRRLGSLILIVHAISSLASVYVAIQVLVWHLENTFLLGINSFLNFACIFLMANLFITAFYGLKIVKSRVWLVAI